MVWDTETDREVSQVITGKPQYLYVNLRKNDNKRVLRRVHNILGWTFLGDPPSDKHTVDHIDMDRFNNKLSNLRWLSKRGQMSNRTNTVHCVCGGNLVDLIQKHYPDDFSKVRGFIFREFGNFVDFNIVKEQYNLYNKYGRSYNSSVSINNNTYVLHELLTAFNLDVTFVREGFTNGLTFYQIANGYKHPLPDNSIYGYEVLGEWFPNKKTLCSKYNLTSWGLNNRLESGMSLEEAVQYDPLDSSRFWLDNYFMNQQEHCDRLGVSCSRIQTKMRRENLTFEEAVLLPLERVDRYCINGEVKKNLEWYAYFNLTKPRTINARLSKNGKNFRKTLECYGVDTSLMEIYPCDGDIICYSRPQ